jgi:type III restriction enzyme
MHDYLPDFIIRFNTGAEKYLILETKGFDPIKEVKKAAAERWVRAVNADGKFGTWAFAMTEEPTAVRGIIEGALRVGIRD